MFFVLVSVLSLMPFLGRDFFGRAPVASSGRWPFQCCPGALCVWHRLQTDLRWMLGLELLAVMVSEWHLLDACFGCFGT